MLPLGILNASTKKVRMNPNSTIETSRIFAHSPKKLSPLRRLFSSRSASIRCSGVISRDADGASGEGSFSGRGEDSLFDMAHYCLDEFATGHIQDEKRTGVRGRGDTKKFGPRSTFRHGVSFMNLNLACPDSCRSAHAATSQRSRDSRPWSPSRTRRPPSHLPGARCLSVLRHQRGDVPRRRSW